MKPSNEIVIDDETAKLLKRLATDNEIDTRSIFKLAGRDAASFRMFLANAGLNEHPDAARVLQSFDTGEILTTPSVQMVRISGWFPKQVTLQTGTSVTIRPMVKEDAEKLHAFFCRVPREDRLFLRDDVSLREVIDSWAEELDYEKVLPLVAEVDDTIVADATLHRRKFGWTSHVGKVRLVVDVDYRGKGLGTLILEALIDTAKKAGLEILVAEIMGSQAGTLSVLKRLGFEKEAVFYNYVKDQIGEEHDLVVMMKNLQIEPAMVPF